MKKLERPVGIIAPSFGVQHGGVERYVERLAAGLADRGVRVEVVAPDRSHDAPALETRDNLTIRRFSTMGRKGSPVPPAAMVAWLIRNARRYSVINAHNLHTWVPPVAALAAKAGGVPFVLTGYWHGTGHSAARRMLHVGYKPIALWTARSAVSVVCNSRAEEELIKRDFGSQRPTRVVPVGIDLPLASGHAIDTREGEANSAETIILCIGRLASYKGAELVVRALPHLPPRYRLVIIGEGPAAETIRAEVVANGVADRTDILGRCSDAELQSWYRRATVCVSMSAHESFGLVVLEAAMAGCAVVASDIDAHRELTKFVPAGRISLVQREAPPDQLARTIGVAADSGRITDDDRPPSDGWRLPTWTALVDNVYELFLQAAR